MVVIKQITPAVGWYAEYKEDTGEIMRTKLAVWAIVEIEPGYECIVGYDSDDGGMKTLSDASDNSNFVRYVYLP